MNKQHIIVMIVGAFVIAGASFWAGTVAGRSASSARGAGGQFSSRAGGFRASGNGAVFGSIISMDSNSITVKLGGGPTASSTNGADTGSKIVLYYSGTQVGKFVNGSPSDLSIGETVLINGTPNSDGSLTAQNIQIRPSGGPGAPLRGQ